MIVVDTNLVAYLLLPSARSKVAESVFRRDRDWAAPTLWRSEFRNILIGNVRRKSLSLADAVRIMGHAENLVRGREHVVRSEDVLRLAEESGCTAYDCEFVAVATQLHVQLVTADDEILAAYEHLAISPEGFVGGV